MHNNNNNKIFVLKVNNKFRFDDWKRNKNVEVVIVKRQEIKRLIMDSYKNKQIER